MGTTRDTSSATASWSRQRRVKAIANFKPRNQLHAFLASVIHNTDYTYAELSVMTHLTEDTIRRLFNGDHVGNISTWDAVINAIGVDLGFRFRTED